MFIDTQMTRGTFTEWSSANQVLTEGKVAFSIDTGSSLVSERVKEFLDTNTGNI
jgi:hypothetical protein